MTTSMSSSWATKKDEYLRAEPTLKLLCSSRLRAGILFSLDNGPKPLSDLRREVEANAPNTSAKAKDLQELGLIERENGNYRLTRRGELVKAKISELVDMITVLDKSPHLWPHIVDCIPPELLEGIGVLSGSEAIGNSKGDLDCVRKLVLKLLDETDGEIYVILPAYSEELLERICRLHDRGIKINMICNREVNRRLKPPLEVRATDELRLGLLLTKRFVFLTTEMMDYGLMNYNERGVAWGRRLFEFYTTTPHPSKEEKPWTF